MPNETASYSSNIERWQGATCPRQGQERILIAWVYNIDTANSLLPVCASGIGGKYIDHFEYDAGSRPPAPARPLTL